MPLNFTCHTQTSKNFPSIYPTGTHLASNNDTHTSISPRHRLLTIAQAMSVVFGTSSSTQGHATSTPSSTDTPYTYHFGSTQSESQSAPPTGTSNPGIALGVLAGLIIFCALLCAWCCKRRFSKTSEKPQIVAGYSLPQYSHIYPPTGGYPQPPAPPPAIVHEQGPWPGYPVHYYNPTNIWAQPGVSSEETFGPRQM